MFISLNLLILLIQILILFTKNHLNFWIKIIFLNKNLFIIINNLY